jgi:AraC-like DNA-binding protein
MKHSQIKPGEPKRMELARKSAAEAIQRWTAGTDCHRSEALPMLSLYRSDHPVGPVSGMYEPSVALVLQGRKRVGLGSESFVYGPGQFLVTSLNLPTVTYILEASPERPFLSLLLALDLREITSLMMDGHLPAPRVQTGERAMAIGRVDWPLAHAIQRMVELLDEPASIPIMAPLVQREILFRLLVGEQGARLRQFGALGSHNHQIARAIDWMKAHYASPLRIDDLASRVRMSSSTFHLHFKTLTAMSPLQYQKWLRLNEARRLMLTEHVDASTAAFRVGYESVSQFSREYRARFGAPPMRDISSLRKAAAVAAVA